MKKKIQGVIFDWAGTTVDYGCMAPVQVFMDIFKMRDIQVTMEEARKPMGLLKRDHIEAMLSMDRIGNLWEKRYGRQWNRKDVDSIYADFEKGLFAILPGFTQPVPGALELMERLRERGIKIGSTTGYTKEMMDVVASGAAEKGYRPDHYITSTEVPGGRPYPYMIYNNMSQLELTSTDYVVKVGDTVADVKEGTEAKVWTVGIIKGSSELGMTEAEVAALDTDELEAETEKVRSRFMEAGAHYVIDEIGKLEAVIDEINNRIAAGERA